jgi:hypothetical protein
MTRIETTIETESGEITIPYGGSRGGGGEPHVAVVGKGDAITLIVYPGELLVTHMTDWGHVGVAFVYSGSAIQGLKLTKAAQGRFLRTAGGRRPHVFVPLDRVSVAEVSDSDSGNTVGTIVDEDTVTLALPKTITGSGGRYFRISRRSQHD